jgi:hypothetical protein
MHKVKVGQPIDIQTDKRYLQHNRDHAMTDVYDALVELITNADDSYGRLYANRKRSEDGGDILIECQEQRRGQPSILVVRDKAEGMATEDMQRCLLTIGRYSSDGASRGYMGRGAKDCTALGDVTFSSIKDERFYQCRLTRDLKFILDIDGRKVTAADRDALGVKRGNGTSVRIELAPGVRLPRFDSLVADLPWHYALRDIMSSSAGSRVLLRRLGTDEQQHLVFRLPDGEQVINEEFAIEGYEGSSAQLRIWRSPEPLEESRGGARFERFGLIVKGRRAIHECSLLSEDLKRNPYARRYFGRIDCPYIDELLQEFEVNRERGSSTDLNPCLLVDPNRRSGLERKHPFVARLLRIPIQRLQQLIARDREEQLRQEKVIANQETLHRLGRLARLAGKFLQQQLDDLEQLSSGDSLDESAFTKSGISIWPTYPKLILGQERSLSIYVKRALIRDPNQLIFVTSDSPASVEVLDSPLLLRPHPKFEDRLIGSFRLRGTALCDDALVLTSSPGLPSAEACARVVEDTPENREFNQAIEFERQDYQVRVGSRKTLHVFAKCPDLVAQPTTAKIESTEPDKIATIGGCRFIPVSGSNYAEAEIKIEGRVLKGRAKITVTVNGSSAQAGIKVVDRGEEPKGIPIEIQLCNEDFGKFRARWAEHLSKPNLLLISAVHKSLARYLGRESDGFPGQDTPMFRVLIAEIVAESICRKALTLEAKERPYDFHFMDLGEPHAIIDDVFGHLHQRLREFVAEAHMIMLSDRDLKNAASQGIPVPSEAGLITPTQDTAPLPV